MGDTGHSPHTADGPRHAALQHVTSPAATLLHTPDTAPVSAVMQCPAPCSVSAPMTAEFRPTFPIQFLPQPLSSPAKPSPCPAPVNHWTIGQIGGGGKVCTGRIGLIGCQAPGAGHSKIYLSSGDQAMVVWSMMTLQD